ncbi:MAG: hypothetical protein QXH80_01490 [Candidatus Nanoarchaeia archaeon]
MKWDDDFEISGADGLELHHLYRAMGFLGCPLEDQREAMKFAPQCTKDLIEEKLFDLRRDMFSNLSSKYSANYVSVLRRKLASLLNIYLL